MNFNKLMICFCMALPISAAIRLIQIVYTIEYANGFYIEGKAILGNLCLFLIAAICLLFVVLCFKRLNFTAKPPKNDAVLSLFSIIAAIPLFGEIFGENLSLAVPALQVLIVKLATLFTAIYFIVFGLQPIFRFKIFPILNVMPCIFAIVKTISAFINVSSLALISDNILLIAGYCSLMFFFINYAKLYNNIDNAKDYAKISATGIAAAIICITQSFALVLINLLGQEPYLHTDKDIMYTLFALGLFSIVFVTKAKKKEHI